MGFAEVIGLVSLIVAVIGAAGGLVYKYLERKDKRPRLMVETGLGELTRKPGILMMFFNVANTGKVTVTVSTIYLELPGDQRMFFPWLEGERPLPCRVEAGEKSIFWQRFRETQDKLRVEGYSGSLPIIVVVEDAVGNRYTKQANFRVSHEEPT